MFEDSQDIFKEDLGKPSTFFIDILDIILSDPVERLLDSQTDNMQNEPEETDLREQKHENLESGCNNEEEGTLFGGLSIYS